MCLIVLGWHAHPDFPLVVAANRDEFYARPSLPADYWPDAPHVWAGRDLEAGGTWMGVTTRGRFAAITNVREPGVPKGSQSRGALPREFLLGDSAAEKFAASIDGNLYSGFNLLVSDGDELWYRSNRDGAARRLAPGVHAVSNHLLDTPWPKLVSAKSRFSTALPDMPEHEALFSILGDQTIVPDEALPNTGVPIEWERLLSAIFVLSENYGTRASTVIARDSRGQLLLDERRFGPGGRRQI